MKKTKAQLKTELTDLKAQSYSTAYFSHCNLHKAGKDYAGGSAVIISIKGLGNQFIIDPVAIRGGLSKDTIEAIKRDIAASQKDMRDFSIKETE
jgi:hypothetical protein